jgi:hypothetical protein
LQWTSLPFTAELQDSAEKYCDLYDYKRLIIMPNGAVLRMEEKLEEGGEAAVYVAWRVNAVGDGFGCVAVKAPAKVMDWVSQEDSIKWCTRTWAKLSAYIKAAPDLYM